ncbi:carbohydrate-binding protein [Paenibacillus alginolyticus]|uniref:Carbohydrate-binding protein n=1 Tax=Paenibacillus alginolyticus TaxID=59839 RepID=A0ABT4GMZ7_9BACL|nr:carbohydrate-binding protein [Paenibacillus alginolyticus]MCY9697368.1 carbohydrate-binding protein [Paenibacillus alginolyticus]MEC0146216.1 carbohydrate-binding protein [Paenibacillus alginolyticus]
MKQWLTGLLAFVLIFSFPASGFSYSNPQIVSDSWRWENGDFYGEGDPFILKFNGVYYLYTSTVDDKPGVKVWSSEDLVHWEYRGLCATEPVTKGAYAPEVVYWNGDFYMYTALLRDEPGTTQRGHRVLKSASPTGPFMAQTGNMVNGIDGDVFIDDDGQWYFYSTGNGNIDVRPMSDPYTFGEKSNTGAVMKGWTEGPTVIKRNGKYYMTYTGNHVWSDAYRVDYASSSSPVTGFVPAASQNPILLDAEGDHVGIGHNSIVRGPDLDSDYMVYHSHANPGRNLNLDRVVWNGNKMLVLGPTTSEQPDPAMPEFSDRFQRNELGDGWKVVGGGHWGIRDGSTLYQDTVGEPGQSHMLLSQKATDDNFTAEFNLQQVEQGTSANPLIGAVFSYKNEKNYGVAVLNRNQNRLETVFRVDGKDTDQVTTPLPVGYDYTKWHQIRVEKEGSDYRIYVDGMLKQTRSTERLGKGKIGYTTTDAHADFGYVAFSNNVGGSSANAAYKPIPGEIQAVHFNPKGNGKSDSDHISVSEATYGGYYVASFNKGNLQYDVNVSETGTYDVVIRYAAGDDARVKLELDDSTKLTDSVRLPSTGGANQWDNLVIRDIKLTQGLHKLKVIADRETFDFASMKFNRSTATTPISDDFNDGDDFDWMKFEQGWRVDTGDAPPFDLPKPVPGIIEAPFYNTGGEGIGYHDNTPENIGGAYRGDSVDIRTNSNFNGLNVGWNQAGEWLKYNIDVKRSGMYRVEVTAATTFNDNQARIWLDDQTDLTGAINIPSTGGWNNWQTTLSQSFYLPEGLHTIKFDTLKGEYDFARLKFVSFDVPKSVPGIVEAVHYNTGGEGVGYHDNTPSNMGGQYRSDTVDIRVNPKGGWNVGWNQTGEWLKYNVGVAKSSVYDISVRIATALNSGKIRLWLDDMTDLTGVVDIPNTGGWNNWKNVKLGDIMLPEGNHTIKVEIVQGEYDFASLSFNTQNETKSLPGTVLAVDYMNGGEGAAYHDNTPDNIRGLYRTDDVDIRLLPEGFTTGWNQTGEWMKYNVNVAETDKYKLDLRVATAMDGSQVRFWLDDTTDLTGIINVPNTGNFQEWMTVKKEGIALPAGNHTIKVEIVTGEFDFYSFRFHNDPIVAKEGAYKSQPKGYPKAVIGDSSWSDYIVETDLKLGSNTQGGSNAGIIFRVNNPADGTELGQNRDDFLQGYLAYLTADGVHLGKFNYNFQYLTGAALTGTVGNWQHMKVVASGTRIRVYVGDMETPLIDYTDRSETAFTHGNIGVRSFNSESFIDNFKVTPIPAK